VSRRMAGWPGAVALGALAAVAVGMGQTSAGHRILQDAGLVAAPVSYTSLAFRNPESLPQQLYAKRADINVSFAIQNAGTAARDYQWSVLLVQGDRVHRLATGKSRIGPGRRTVITRSAATSCSPGQARIVVKLAHPAENIDALTVCRSRRS
jgi:hypothetical protein